MMTNYPHIRALDYFETVIVVDQTLVMSTQIPGTSGRHDEYGTPIEARVRLNPLARGCSGESSPFFPSLLFLIYLLFPYCMFTLEQVLTFEPTIEGLRRFVVVPIFVL